MLYNESKGNILALVGKANKQCTQVGLTNSYKDSVIYFHISDLLSFASIPRGF
jgi:hypothetical protein